MKIIIQAGGRGTRLEGLTRNKPKCLVPVNNLPIIFYAFNNFKNAEFSIIADYKLDVLKKYLDIFAKDYNYKLFHASKKGTVSGIKEIIKYYEDNESFMVLWCDLILSDSFVLPEKKGNYVGISKDFECRYSYIDDKFIKEPSKDNGVAGLFIFENKKYLEDIPEEGALVEWLQTQNIIFNRLGLYGSKEIGTMISYNDNSEVSKCRPFNKIEFQSDSVIKTPITEQGIAIAKDEIAWYKKVKDLKYEYIPEIYSYEPLTMKRTQGKNIYEYDCLTRSQKEILLSNIITALDKLHNMLPPIDADINDIRNNYITKTLDRLSKVEKLIPFADKEFIRINNQYYKNIFFSKEKFTGMVENFLTKKFCLIHGDCTFSNIIFDTFNEHTVLIDPRGYFGKTKLYGDVDYDWAKLYYSLIGNYDQFNMKKFNLDIKEDGIELAIKPNNWSDMEEFFFDNIPDVNKQKIKFLHSVIWLSLTTYVWEDYDSICGAFYNGIINARGIL